MVPFGVYWETLHIKTREVVASGFYKVGSDYDTSTKPSAGVSKEVKGFKTVGIVLWVDPNCLEQT